MERAGGDSLESKSDWWLSLIYTYLRPRRTLVHCRVFRLKRTTRATTFERVLLSNNQQKMKATEPFHLCQFGWRINKEMHAFILMCFVTSKWMIVYWICNNMWTFSIKWQIYGINVFSSARRTADGSFTLLNPISACCGFNFFQKTLSECFQRAVKSASILCWCLLSANSHPQCVYRCWRYTSFSVEPSCVCLVTRFNLRTALLVQSEAIEGG